MGRSQELEEKEYYSNLDDAAHPQSPLWIRLIFIWGPFALATYALWHIFQLDTIPIGFTGPNYVIKMVPVFLVLIGLEATVSMAKGWGYFTYQDGTNSISMGAFENVCSSLFRFLRTVPYMWIYDNYSLISAPAEVNMIWWIGTFVAVDFCYYWLHRTTHEFNVLWAGHNVHHSSRHYNLTTAFRQGVLQSLFSWPFYLPLAFFIPDNLGPLEWIFNTPSHHRVHHGSNPQYIDKNYGGSLIIFDRLFGTFEPEVEEVNYGITHTPATWDVFVLQFHHLKETWEAAVLSVGWLTKFRCFIDLGPSYTWTLLHYKEAFGKNPPKHVNHPPPPEPSTEKYNSTVRNWGMLTYHFLHFSLLIFFTFILLDGWLNSSPTLVWLGRINAVFGIWAVNRWIDGKYMPLWMEAIRIGISIYLLVEMGAIRIQYLPLVIMYGAIPSLSWFSKYSIKFEDLNE